MELETLSKKKMAQLNKQPIIETQISKSEDGNWIIHKTTITDLKPANYWEAIIETP